MIRYSVYLEIAGQGTCMAHVLDLPGCMVRAGNKEDALTALPDAICDYHTWLRRHGEPVPLEDDPVEIEVAGESRDTGPFDPGDTAALFAPDKVPVTPDEIEHHFQLLAYTRADLLDLVRDPSTGSGQVLPDDVLDWQPDPESYSIRRLLRHIGNAEEWYVSRIVPPETLPPEWEHDEDLLIFEFLEMERRTAFARLRQLTEKERSAVFYPTHFTSHPEEPWTVRKALRRFLEHEREHTAQAREILTAWRSHLLARLAEERTRLLEQINGLDVTTLSESPIFDDWTAKDLLAHIPAWDELFTERIELILDGRENEIATGDLDARNAAFHAERKDWSLARAMEACVDARADFLTALSRLSDADLHRRRHFSWGDATVRQWTQWRAWHDAGHANDLAAWRQAQNLEHQAGRRGVLMARLAAERAGLLEQVAGLDERGLTKVPVLDGWTIKDLLAHITAWDRFELQIAKRVLGGEVPDFTPVEGMDAHNAAVVALWRYRTLAEVLVEVQGARATWVAWLRSASDAEFFRERSFHGHPWSFAHSLKVEWQHDAEHAAQIAAWRKTQGLEGKAGPREVLLFALAAAREELLTAAALVPPDERESRPVCGEWTLKDVLGHLADWEWFGLDVLRQVASGRAPQIEDFNGDEEAQNQVYAQARCDQPWVTVWADFLAARQALLEVLRGMNQTQLIGSFSTSWGTEGTPYGWAHNYLAHDRDHAQGLRVTSQRVMSQRVTSQRSSR